VQKQTLGKVKTKTLIS